MCVCVCNLPFLLRLGSMCDENGNRGDFTIKVKGKAFRATFEVDRYTPTVSRFPASGFVQVFTLG